MAAAHTLMADLKDKGEHPYPDDTRFVLEINPDRREAVIEFCEPLAFHRDRFDESWHRLVDSNGYLTARAQTRLAEAYQKILAERGVCDVRVEYCSGLEFEDQPSVALAFISTYSEGETFRSWFERSGWPIIAGAINCTDPGTFDCPYVYARLIES